MSVPSKHWCCRLPLRGSSSRNGRRFYYILIISFHRSLAAISNNSKAAYAIPGNCVQLVDNTVTNNYRISTSQLSRKDADSAAVCWIWITSGVIIRQTRYPTVTPLTKCVITMTGTPVEWANSVKYLGVTFYCKSGLTSLSSFFGEFYGQFSNISSLIGKSYDKPIKLHISVVVLAPHFVLWLRSVVALHIGQDKCCLQQQLQTDLW